MGSLLEKLRLIATAGTRKRERERGKTWLQCLEQRTPHFLFFICLHVFGEQRNSSCAHETWQERRVHDLDPLRYSFQLKTRKQTARTNGALTCPDRGQSFNSQPHYMYLLHVFTILMRLEEGIEISLGIHRRSYWIRPLFSSLAPGTPVDR